MKRLSTVLLSFSLTTGLAAALPMVAHADRDDTSKYSFSYSAADLSSPDRVAELHRKIEVTAREHCPSYLEIRSISESRSCVRDVTRDLEDDQQSTLDRLRER